MNPDRKITDPHIHTTNSDGELIQRLVWMIRAARVTGGVSTIRTPFATDGLQVFILPLCCLFFG